MGGGGSIQGNLIYLHFLAREIRLDVVVVVVVVVCGRGGGIGNAPARTPVCSHTVGWQHRVGWDVGVGVGLGTMIDMSWSGCHSIVT